MRVLELTNLYPSPERPTKGIFIQTQIEAVRKLGIESQIYVIRGEWPLDYVKAIVRVRKLVARQRFDLIHAHFGLSGFVAVQQRSTPVIISYLGSDLLGIPDTRGRQTVKGRLFTALSRYAASRAAAIVVMSDELGRALRTDRRYHVIPHGIDTEFFQPQDPVTARSALALEGEHPRVLFAADPTLAVKRIALARRAMDVVRRQEPDAELVVMHGRNQADVVQAMSACQALVLTSRQEGGPNVVKEAMACNLPVVSTRVGDVEEVLAGCQGNWIVDPQPAAVATGLLQALAYGRTDARERIIERYSLSESARLISALYESVA